MVYRMGYKCPWDKFPQMQFLDGDPYKVELIDKTPEPGLSILGSKQHALLGRPIKPNNVPTTLLWQNRGDMPDFEGPPGFLCVSPRLKEIIERFEPDVHQYFPLHVVNEKKERIAEHYLWVVCNLIDSVDREHTTMILRNGRTWTSEELIDGKLVRVVESPKLVFSHKQTDGYHFWRDPFLTGGVFMRQMRRAKLCWMPD